MRVNLSPKGEVIAAGEGSFRIPQAVKEQDHALTHPVKTAEKLRELDREERQKIAKAEKERAKRNKEEAKRVAAEFKRSREYQEHLDEIAKAENVGEHPLMYLAAMQSMNGSHRDYQYGISGYGLSTDGVPAYDRAMGFSFADITGAIADVSNTINQIATPIMQTAKLVTGPSAAEIEAARQKAIAEAQAQAMALALAQAPVSTGGGSTILTIPTGPGGQALSPMQQFLKAKIGPVPAPVAVGVVALLGAYLILKK